MNYYKEKMKAFQLIDEMYANGDHFDKIYFKISTIFGFNKKIIKERIELLENVSRTSA